MKSLTAVCQTGASMPAMKPQSGRVTRPPQHRTNGENAEMRMYLSKLKDLVPFMPKNRKLSKLEIIQHVIDYICDLQTELESHPDIDSYDGARELLATPNRHFAIDLNGSNSGSGTPAEDEADDEAELEHDQELSNAVRLAADAAMQQQQLYLQQQQSSPAARQPLVDRNAPNTFLQTTATTASPAVTTLSIATTTTTATQQQPQQQQHQQQQQQQTTQMDTSEKEQQSRRSC